MQNSEASSFGSGNGKRIRARITSDKEKRRMLAGYRGDPVYRQLAEVVQVEVIAGSAVWVSKLEDFRVMIRISGKKWAEPVPIRLSFIDFGPLTPELKTRLGIPSCT